MKFAILAVFSGGPINGYCSELTINDVERYLGNTWAADLGVDLGEEGDSEYCYLADDCTGSEREFWQKAKDIHVSGILDREDFYHFYDSLCTYADSSETLGSLTEAGWQPDISMVLETPHVIASIRVTPMPEIKNKPTGDARDWARCRKAFLNIFGNEGKPIPREQWSAEDMRRYEQYGWAPKVYPDPYHNFRR